MSDTVTVYRVSIKYWDLNNLIDEIEVRKITEFQYVNMKGSRHSLTTEYCRFFKTKAEAIEYLKKFMEIKKKYATTQLELVNKRLAELESLETWEGLTKNE